MIVYNYPLQAAVYFCGSSFHLKPCPGDRHLHMPGGKVGAKYTLGILLPGYMSMKRGNRCLNLSISLWQYWFSLSQSTCKEDKIQCDTKYIDFTVLGYMTPISICTFIQMLFPKHTLPGSSIVILLDIMGWIWKDKRLREEKEKA